jgi:membrane associated rhomboid family serine protease
LIFPAFFVFLIWFIKIIEISVDTDFSHFGIYPRELKGLPGIITAPFIHDDFKHLFDNTIPVFTLSLTIFYFYREIAYRIVIIIYLVTGLLVWIAGREAYHIGASGLIYGFAGFLFVSGIIRRNVNLLAISLLVIFLYGSLIWGILPYDYRISWESHLLGGLTGIAVAFLYHDQGPQRTHCSWEDEEEDVDEEENK